MKIIILLLLTGSIVLGSSNRTYNYSLKKVYSTLIRYIAVNRRDKILEKDIEGAYIIFQINDSGKTIEGSVEIIDRGKEKSQMKLYFKGAHYREVLFMKKFEKKLKEELR